jgi:hypothetical protein
MTLKICSHVRHIHVTAANYYVPNIEINLRRNKILICSRNTILKSLHKPFPKRKEIKHVLTQG